MVNLKDEKIKSIFIHPDKTFMLFFTDGGSFAYTTTGDCCSKSWIEHFSGIDNLIGSVVVDVFEVNMHHLDIDNTDDYGNLIQHYGVKFTTSKGYADLEYRNDSNGYYGGNIELDYWEDERGIWSLGELQPLTEDF